MELTFPLHLDRIRDCMLAQADTLRAVSRVYADALAAGNCVHVYANGHSRVTVEETCVRMGALTGFHPILNTGLANFTDVVGANGLRVNQTIERVEGLGRQLLDETAVAAGEPLVVVSATGQTQAAVDIAVEWLRRYPDNPIICVCSLAQASKAPAKHSCGKTLWHIAAEARHGFLLDNGMPYGDTAVAFDGTMDSYHVCPLSSIGSLTITHCLNELTIRELDARGVAHPHLRNMHLANTAQNYDQWLADQRMRYAKTLYRPDALGS